MEQRKDGDDLYEWTNIKNYIPIRLWSTDENTNARENTRRKSTPRAT